MQVVFYFMDGTQGGFLGSHEKIGRVNLVAVELGNGYTADRIHFLYAVYLVSPENDAEQVVCIRQVDIDRIAFDAEIPAVEVDVVADVKAIYQPAQENVTAEVLSLLHFDDIVVEVRRIAHAIDARYGGNHHDVFPAGE